MPNPTPEEIAASLTRAQRESAPWGGVKLAIEIEDLDEVDGLLERPDWDRITTELPAGWEVSSVEANPCIMAIIFDAPVHPSSEDGWRVCEWLERYGVAVTAVRAALQQGTGDE